MNHCLPDYKSLRLGGLMALGLLALSLLGPGLILAAPALLPPRPTPMPPAAALPAGGAIMLQVQGDVTAWPSLWTQVEWRDEAGAWYPVEGWVGPLDKTTASGGEKGWGVPPDHFGLGPFRWVLYERQGGERLMESTAFWLPGQARETVTVTVALNPPLLPATGGGWLALGVGPGLVLLAGGLLLRRRTGGERRNL